MEKATLPMYVLQLYKSSLCLDLPRNRTFTYYYVVVITITVKLGLTASIVQCSLVQPHVDLWLLANEVLVDPDGGLVELVEVDDQRARRVLGQLVHDDEATAEAVGVVQPEPQ